MERVDLPPVPEVPNPVASLERDQIVVKSNVGGLVNLFVRRSA